MRTSKRILCLLLCLTMLAAFLPRMAPKARAATYSGTCGDNLNWSLDTGTGKLTVTGSGAMTDWHDAYDVPWKNYKSSIRTVSLPAGLTRIGGHAFEDCTKVTSVTIPGSVTEIGEDAFAYCDGLTSVSIPANVSVIDEYAFYRCVSLSSVTLPSSLTVLGAYALSGCSSLTTAAVPAGITELDYGVFDGCTALKSVSLPSGLTTVHSAAFKGCTALTSLTLPAAVTAIEDFAFYGSGLTAISIPKNVRQIDCQAFDSCGSLKKFTVDSANPYFSAGSDGALYNKNKTALLIVPGGFQGTFTILDSVTSIETTAFYGCSKLTGISAASSQPKFWTDSSGVLFTKDKKTLLRCAPGYQGSYTVPGTAQIIDESAFTECAGLTAVTIPDSVTEIGIYAFAACTGLTKVDIPDSVTTLGPYAFDHCDKLTSVTIPGSLTCIPAGAFEQCQALTSVVISEGVVEIRAEAFYSCPALTYLRIPNSVTSIGQWAFCECRKLTAVMIPASVTTFGSGAFGYQPMTIYGYAGTEAETFAAQYASYGFVFVPLTDSGHDCPCAHFVDMPAYGTIEHTAIDWAYTHDPQITSGMNDTSFGTGKTLTRAQAATFLYAGAGKPAFNENTAGNPFSDVPAGKWFTKAVLWAASNNLVAGYTDGTFKPNGTLTRGQIMVILYAWAGKPSVSGMTNPYTDAPAGKWFTNAAVWAYYAGIEKGSGKTFAQSTPCTRETFVVYLYRYLTGEGLAQ